MDSDRVPRLLVVTDRSVMPAAALARVLAAVLDRLPRGTLGVYYREPGLSDREAFAEIQILVGACRRSGRKAPVLVRGRPDIALAAGADGVHLQAGGIPPGDVRAAWPGLTVGYSAHSVAEVRRVARGVDYVTFSPVWASPGKGPPAGLAALARACRAAASTPVLALGGVTTAVRARAAVRAGARGVAAVRGPLASPDPAAAVMALAVAVAGRRIVAPRV